MRYVKEESIKEIMGKIKLKSNKKASINRFLKYKGGHHSLIYILKDSIYLYNSIGITQLYGLQYKEYLEHYKDLWLKRIHTDELLKKMKSAFSTQESECVYPFKLPDTPEVVQASKLDKRVYYNDMCFNSKFLADLLVLLEDKDLVSFSIDPTSDRYSKTPILIKSSKGRAILCPVMYVKEDKE